MSSKLKKLLLSFVIILIVAGGGFFIFSTISNMNDVVITDFRIVDSNGTKAMKDTSVYLGEISENKLNIKVSVSAQGYNGGYFVYSTNKDVAEIKSNGDGYTIEYSSPGTAKIVAQSNMVPDINDSFVITVHENIPVDFNFEHTVHAENKEMTVYADNEEYRYKYNLTGILDDESAGSLNPNVRASSIRVVDNFDHDLFSKIEVDHSTNELVVVVNSIVRGEIVTSKKHFINLQSVVQDAEGNDSVVENFFITTNIVGNKIEDMQLVVSHSPNFDGATYIYSTHPQKSEYVYENETLIDNIYLTSNVNTIYVKVRLVFTNHHAVDYTQQIAPSNQTDDSKAPIAFDNGKIIMLTIQKTTTFGMHLPAEVSPLKENYTKDFTLNFVEGELSVSDLYSTHTENGVTYYRYKYFDPRFKRSDAIVDGQNRIIGFSNLVKGIDY